MSVLIQTQRSFVNQGHTMFGSLVLLATCLALAGSAFARARVIRIAKTGDPVPGVPDATFRGVYVDTIDASGNIFFAGLMQGPGIDGSNNNALFYGRPRHFELYLRERDPTPQFGEGVSTWFYGHCQMAQTGEIAFSAMLRGEDVPSSEDGVILAGTPENLRIVAQEGHTPPDVNDGNVYVGSFLTSVAMGRGGHVAFSAGLGAGGGSGSNNGRGLWSGRPDNPRLVARTGDHAPGTEPGVYFSLSYLTPGWSVNRRGAFAFPAPIDGPGVNETNNAGIWAGTHDDLALVMRIGDPAPVPENGAIFVGFPQYALINGNDRVLFPEYVRGDGIDATNNYGLWAGTAGGAIEPIARAGDPVPMLGADYSISYIFPFVQTEDDRVAMVATLNGPNTTSENNEAIFFGRPGNWELVFREGDQAPELPNGVVLSFDNHPLHLVFNDSGAAGILMGLGGVGVDDSNDEVLVRRSSINAAWQLVAREGELFDGSIIKDGGLVFLPTGGGEGGRPMINDRGEMVFWVVFDDEPPDTSVVGSYYIPQVGAVESSGRLDIGD